MPVFEIKREGSEIHVKLDPLLHNVGARIVTATAERGSELSAELLLRRLEQVLGERMEQIRRAAYLDGYRAGRGKKAKEQYFSNGL